MFAPSCLDAGLLVDAEYVIARPQRSTFPPTLVEIDDAAGFAGKLRIAREPGVPLPPGSPGDRSCSAVGRTSVPITLKVPENVVRDVRAYSVISGLTISEIVTRAITAFLAAVRGHG